MTHQEFIQNKKRAVLQCKIKIMSLTIKWFEALASKSIEVIFYGLQLDEEQSRLKLIVNSLYLNGNDKKYTIVGPAEKIDKELLDDVLKSLNNIEGVTVL